MLASLSVASALAAFAAVANAHITMKSPVPYDASTGIPSTSPLNADGSDWPCKMGDPNYDVTKIATMNNIVAGQSQILSFIGSAVHGGGSCQLSLSMDKTITKTSQFKVFHSIEGGCPSNAPGNLPDGQNDPTTFNWTLPTNMPNGQYSLAWTWFNKIGNREMYMNCAPITVTGGASDQNGFNALPDMFVANIAGTNGKYNGNQWGTTETKDTQFPEPGPSVEIEPKDANLGPPVNKAGGSVSIPAAPASSGTSSDATSGGSSAAAPAAPASPSPASSAAATIPSPAAVAPQSTPISSPAPGGSAPSGSCASGSVACSSPGAVVCIGPTQFGICDLNSCAVAQALAAGTVCSNGAITKRDLPGSFYTHAHFRHGRHFVHGR